MFRTIRKPSEPKEYCTLTVREVARLFEAAGVARTERSITNWCQPNKMGVARLENYFDPNERKYFISPKSVELQKEREGFAQERQGYVGKLMNFNRKVGELETKLLQLEAPERQDASAPGENPAAAAG